MLFRSLDGEVYSLDDNIVIDKNKRHDLYVVVDRIKKKEGVTSRLTDSVEKCLQLANGCVMVNVDGENHLHSVKNSCVDCGISLPDIEPSFFSFNSHSGACPKCSGLGYVLKIGESSIVKNEKLSINEGALTVMGFNIDATGVTKKALAKLAKNHGFSLDTPYCKIPLEARDILINGERGDKELIAPNLHQYLVNKDALFMGIVPDLLRKFSESSSEYVKEEIYKLMSMDTCPECKGKRLNASALAIKINNKNIADVCEMQIGRAHV